MDSPLYTNVLHILASSPSVVSAPLPGIPNVWCWSLDAFSSIRIHPKGQGLMLLAFANTSPDIFLTIKMHLSCAPFPEDFAQCCLFWHIHLCQKKTHALRFFEKLKWEKSIYTGALAGNKLTFQVGLKELSSKPMVVLENFRHQAGWPGNSRLGERNTGSNCSFDSDIL